MSGPPADIDSAPDVSHPPPPFQQQHHRQQEQPPQQQVSMKPKYDSQQLINVTKQQALSDGDRYKQQQCLKELIHLIIQLGFEQ